MKKILLTLVAALFMGTGLMAQNATVPQNITLRTVDGQSVPSSVIQNDGRPVIVSFWATWCKPCNRELNNIKEVYEEWQEETGVKLVAVSIDDARSANRVKPHVEGKDWPFEVYLDQNRDFARAMNAGANPPYTYLINGEGEIVWQHTGYLPGAEEEIIEKVRELLK